MFADNQRALSGRPVPSIPIHPATLHLFPLHILQVYWMEVDLSVILVIGLIAMKVKSLLAQASLLRALHQLTRMGIIRSVGQMCL
jgi:hypothetical protein